MWSYYGSKSKFVNLYPSPKFKTIIEPFAGTAQYSLFGDNWKRQVILCDKYQPIIDIWTYLIHVSPNRILELPDIEHGKTVDDYDLMPVEKQLIGFCINRGSAQPKKSPAQFNNWSDNKKRIARDLHKIRHWKVINGSYEELPNIEATWFIDPPYQFAGKWYHSSVSNKSIDYKKLETYSRSRLGQVIVCENLDANWLPFNSLLKFHGQLKSNTEAIWLNEINDTLLSFASNHSNKTEMKI
jgi:hypothetical protein